MGELHTAGKPSVTPRASVPKTNAMRILEAAGLPFGTASYEADEEFLDAVPAARSLGAEPEAVFKTIVMRTESNEVCVFCVPANAEVSLKKARAVTGAREIGPVKPSELLALTGYVRGGCSPIGMKRRYRTFVDETVYLLEEVFVSAGLKGLQLKLSPETLVGASGATVVDLAAPA